jgi:hypothetical protein
LEATVTLNAEHHAYLAARAVTDEAIAARSYFSSPTAAQTIRSGEFSRSQAGPGLLIPIWSPTGECVGHHLRRDEPRQVDGKVRKFEYPARHAMHIDVPPLVRELVQDVERPLWITEGIVKGDALAGLGLAVVALLGVECWRAEGRALPDWWDVPLKGRTVIVAFDSDVMVKAPVARALTDLSRWLDYRGAQVRYCYLPPDNSGAKQGVDDFIAAHTGTDVVAALAAHVTDEQRAVPDEPPPRPPPGPPPPPRSLDDVIGLYRRVMKLDDPDPLIATLAAYAANQLPGDPVWLGVVGGSSRGKTEIVAAVAAMPDAAMVSDLSGPASLLSATSRRERSADATGGLLRRIGEHGVMILKDFTTVLSMHRDRRAEILAAFREIYDGEWHRDVGTDGGQSLEWKGHCGLIFGCTTALDSAHAVVGAMGERFLLIRVRAEDDLDLAEASMIQIGREAEMRAAMRNTVAGLLAHIDRDNPRLPDEEVRDALKPVAALAVRMRSPVERDWQGQLVRILDSEGPGRMIKALDRLRAGAEAIGLGRDRALALAQRVAFDSVPPLRVAVFRAVTDAGTITTSEAAARVDHPTRSVRRALEELDGHGLLERLTGSQAKDIDSDVDGRADHWRASDYAQRLLAMIDGQHGQGTLLARTDEHDLI